MFNKKIVLSVVSLTTAALLAVSSCSASQSEEKPTLTNEGATLTNTVSEQPLQTTESSSSSKTLVTKVPETTTEEPEVTETEEATQEPTTTEAVKTTPPAPSTIKPAAPKTTKKAPPAKVTLGAKTTIYATANANIRSGPGTDNNVVGSVVFGQKLVGQLYGNSGWYLIGNNKYISSTVVSKTKPKAPETTKQKAPETTKPKNPPTTQSKGNSGVATGVDPGSPWTPKELSEKEKKALELEDAKYILNRMKSRGYAPVPGKPGCYTKDGFESCFGADAATISIWPK